MYKVWITWDPVKNRVNRRKHGLGFETAQQVFHDPVAFHHQDRYIEGEERWQTFGLVQGQVLAVAHTWLTEDQVRIISARKATPQERKRYYAHRSP